MRTTLTAVLTLLLAASSAFADDIYVKSGTAELPLKNVTITTVKDGEIFFQISGRNAQRFITDINRIVVVGDDAFNKAEQAFADAAKITDDKAAKAKYAEAVTGYQSALKSNKPWMKEFAAARLQTAAPKSGRFDVAMAAWIDTVKGNPAGAAKNKPALDGVEKDSKYLADAAKALQAAANSTSKGEEKLAYLQYLGDVQTYIGDADGALKTLEQIVQISGTPEQKDELAIKKGSVALAKKDFAAAAAAIAAVNVSALPDPQRAEANFILAEAAASKLQPTSPADAWKDVAIDYMRVVVGDPKGANAAPSLLKVAQIHETIKEPETALKIYQQVAKDYAGTPAATEAQKSADRLGKSARG